MDVIHFDKDAFDKAIELPGKSVLVDFWAPWCGPCRMLGPILEEIAAEHEELIVGKINVDENQELAVRYEIDAIPAVFLFKDGQLVKRLVGFMDKKALLAKLGI